MHYIMVLKSAYKIKLYSIRFQWQPPRSLRESSIYKLKYRIKKNRLIIRKQLDPLRIFINVGHGGHRRAVLMKTVNHRKNSRRFRLPYFNTVGKRRWQGCQPYAPAAFTTSKYSWYSLLLQAESTTGP
jgi:hypothetical protein